MSHSKKIYIVTNGELSAGYQTAQVAHVIAEYCFLNVEAATTWDAESGSLIVLETDTAEALYNLRDEANALNIQMHIFREPDIGDEITAVLFTPGEATVNLLKGLRCTGRSTSEDSTKRRIEIAKRRHIEKMINTEQAKGQNILEHGRSVREHYFALVEHLNQDVNLDDYPNWKVPAWLDTYREQLLELLPSTYVMDRYLTLHDCGKPAVLEYDADGRKHFPNHSQSSEKHYLKVFSSGSDADTQISNMIRDDMLIHLLKADGVAEFTTNRNAIGHLIAGLAELTSNAVMFGGIESNGFKMKYKALDQRGKAICRNLFGEVNK